MAVTESNTEENAGRIPDLTESDDTGKGYDSSHNNGEAKKESPTEDCTRLAWIRMFEEGGSAREVCSRFGISRKTFYKWLKRYRESNGNPESLKDRSRRPHRIPRSTPESVVFLLHEVRRKTGFGQRRLKVYLKEKHAISISERTIWKILKRNRGSANIVTE